MKVTSNPFIVKKNDEEIFNSLLDFKFIETVMPESVSKFEFLENGFSFVLNKFAPLKVFLKEKVPNSKIVFESGSERIDFDLSIDIKHIDNTNSEIMIDFDGKLNPMMEFMAKHPINRFVTDLGKKISEL